MKILSETSPRVKKNYKVELNEDELVALAILADALYQNFFEDITRNSLLTFKEQLTQHDYFKIIKQIGHSAFDLMESEEIYIDD